MHSRLLTSCDHVDHLCNPKGLYRLSRAAELIASAANRPALSIGKEIVPQCLHTDCRFPLSRTVLVCVECVYMSCLSACTDASSPTQQPNHTVAHYQASAHAIFLSVEHAHLYCVRCNDFVFNKFLDAAIAMQFHIARAHRRSFTTSLSPLDPMIQSGLNGEHSLDRNRLKRRRLVTRNEWTPTPKELESFAQFSFPFLSPKTGVRPPVGLFNLGNSCYMNSVLQAFLNAPPLRSFFLADEHKPYCTREPKLDCFACAMDQLVCDSCFTTDPDPSRREKNSNSSLEVPFLVPQIMLDIVWRHAEHLATYAQHDAHEFLIAALNVLSTHCRREKPVTLSDARYADERTKLESTPSLTSKKDSPLMHKDSSKARANINPVSPITNVRADPGGNFAATGFASSRSTTNIVHNLFSGTLQSDVVCRVCGNSSPTLEKFYDISLDVDKLIKPSSARRSRTQSPGLDGMEGIHGRHGSASAAAEERIPRKAKLDDKMDSGSGTPVVPSENLRTYAGAGHNAKFSKEADKDADFVNTLEECLSRFTEPELLGSCSKMYCASCETRQEAMKQMSIRTLPPIVCLHFKRFEQSFASVRRSEMVKIDTPVEFPADGLDLTAFQTSEVLRRRQKSDHAPDTKSRESALMAAVQQKLETNEAAESEDIPPSIRTSGESIYDLFAVVNHIGKIDSGHYTALIRRQGVWFRCDDEKVSRETDIGATIRSEEAYLVFYVQRFPNFQF